MAGWPWFWPLACLAVIVLCSGVAWHLYRLSVPVAAVTDNSQKPAELKKLPWPADVGDFEFVDPKLRAIASECDAIARRVYANLSHDNYDEQKRAVNHEAILARWYVADQQGFPLAPTRGKSPTRSASIHLVSDQTGKISDVILIAASRASEDWTASVQYSVARNAWFHINIFGSAIPMNSSGVHRIDLVNPSLLFDNSPSQDRGVTVSFASSLLTDAELARQPITGDAITPFFQSAESLRDEALRRIDLLAAKVQQQIRSGSGFTETDWSDVRSDNPPRPMRRPTGPLTKETEQSCLRRATEILQQRRGIINEHYRSMHQVVVDAFPFLPVIVQQFVISLSRLEIVPPLSVDNAEVYVKHSPSGHWCLHKNSLAPFSPGFAHREGLGMRGLVARSSQKSVRKYREESPSPPAPLPEAGRGEPDFLWRLV